VQEPDREEEGAGEEHVLTPQAIAAEAEPKAYAFDGWGMVPLELDPV
jgi:hypothetical protein